MTNLVRIKIQQLRNLAEIDLQVGPRFNIFYGDNGSGKTSFLEAIHYLGLGRSFRTRQHARVINHDQNQFTLFSQLQHDNTLLSLGLTRAKSGEAQLRLAGAPTQLSTVADLLPIQLIHPDGHKLLTAGPKHRRQYLDWGVFHVEHSFYQNWQRANRALQQRNRLLKSGTTRYQDVAIWDKELSQTSEIIHHARCAYLNNLEPIIFEIFENMGLDIQLITDYQPGWDTEQELISILEHNFARDKKFGFTLHGPHKADLCIKVHNKPAHEVLSQGQQKMLVYALKLSQSRLLHMTKGKQSIFLIDDLPAELDQHRRTNLTQLLATFSSQVFITGIEQETLSPFIDTDSAKLFHVKHGAINTGFSEDITA